MASSKIVFDSAPRRLVEHIKKEGIACIAHKSLEIFDRCRLWQQNSPAMPDNSAAFGKNSLFLIHLFLKQVLKWAWSACLRAL
jgi:hypothetical protein